MSMAAYTLSASLPPPKFSLRPPSRFRFQTPLCLGNARRSTLPPTGLQFFKRRTFCPEFASSPNKLGLRLRVSAERREGDSTDSINVGEAKRDGEEEFRGESTMPERFRHLTKEIPDPPVRWPLFVALPFLVYAWRSVLWELGNWKKLLVGIIHAGGYALKLVLALIFYFIGDPINYTILYIETAFHSVRSFYSSIVSSAPVPELITIIMLASAVLAVAEAALPNSANNQPNLLILSGIIGYAAVRGFISEPLFWTMLVGLFSFARFIKKRDYVSSTLPVAAVLASVGEPWVRAVVLISFTALAINHYSKDLPEGKEEPAASARRLPLPLLGVALAVGIRLAAQWAGYRHLTWMIV